MALSACTGPEAEAPTPDPHALEKGVAAQAAAAAAAAELGSTLKGRLMGAMKAEGPAGAVAMCAGNASALTVEVGRTHRAKLGRSSLRLRNPDNAGPSWVQEWLVAQGERSAEGVQGLSEIVDAEGARSARLLKPLAVEAPCLVCHGPTPVPEVAAVLAERYPKDRATGYAVGELRGALWVEVEIE